MGREARNENLREGLLTFVLSGALGDPKLCHVPCCSRSGGGGLGPELWGIFSLAHSQHLHGSCQRQEENDHPFD